MAFLRAVDARLVAIPHDRKPTRIRRKSVHNLL